MNPLRLTSLALLLALSTGAFSEDLTAEKKLLIDEFLSITGGAIDLGEVVTSIYIDSMSTALRQSSPNVDANVIEALEDEVTNVVSEEVGDKDINKELSYPIYHKYLTGSEITELISFYKSPIGRKTINILPDISQETLMAGQAWARGLGPKIQERVLERFQREGINLE